jgi:hypothetical protein
MEALAWTRQVMARLGLALNTDKTSIRKAREKQFDFLGYTFGPHRFRKRRPLVSGCESVPEEFCPSKAEGEGHPELRQCWCLAGGTGSTERLAAGLVELLQLRDSAVGVSGV